MSRQRPYRKSRTMSIWTSRRRKKAVLYWSPLKNLSSFGFGGLISSCLAASMKATAPTSCKISEVTGIADR